MHFFTFWSFTQTHRPTETQRSQHSTTGNWRIQIYRQLENATKREYRERIREVEYAVFTAPVFSTTGGQGKEITIAYKQLSELLATKRITDLMTNLF